MGIGKGDKLAPTEMTDMSINKMKKTLLILPSFKQETRVCVFVAKIPPERNRYH